VSRRSIWTSRSHGKISLSTSSGHIHCITRKMRSISRAKPIVRRVALDTSALEPQVRSRRGLYAEWILTNGLGGYASGTVGGLNTRRFHGWLVAALPAPHGRTMMVNHLRERFYSGDREFVLDCEELVPELTNSEFPTADPVIPQSDPVLPALHYWRSASA
jgi:hypothetical protein